MTIGAARSSTGTSLLGALCLACMPIASTGQAVDAVGQATWTFQAQLDGSPIGQHSFSLVARGEQREMTIAASFDVKLLGITVYRYRHRNVERWDGDCLTGLSAETDDDGNKQAVEARRDAAGLLVTSRLAPQTLGGCVMSFAYWNPALLKQTQLLNSQTGRFEKVRIESLGNETIESQGRSVTAARYRIVGTEQPIDLWYTPAGDWVGLASTVSGGKRKLSYRRL
ncbi:MAG: hypothetical protein RL375_3229 [Pseudomonadota bacterium]